MVEEVTFLCQSGRIRIFFGRVSQNLGMNTNTRNLWKVIFSPIIIGKLVACEMLLTVFLPLEKFDRICRPSWEKVTSLTNSLESLPASWLPNTGQPGPIKNVSRSGRHRDRAKCQFDGHKSGLLMFPCQNCHLVLFPHLRTNSKSSQISFGMY